MGLASCYLQYQSTAILVLNAAHLDLDNRRHVFLRQPVEQDDLVQPVEEFRAEMGAHHVHHLRFDRFDLLAFFDDYGPHNGATRLVPGSHRPATRDAALDPADEDGRKAFAPLPGLMDEFWKQGSANVALIHADPGRQKGRSLCVPGGQDDSRTQCAAGAAGAGETATR